MFLGGCILAVEEVKVSRGRRTPINGGCTLNAQYCEQEPISAVGLERAHTSDSHLLDPFYLPITNQLSSSRTDAMRKNDPPILKLLHEQQPPLLHKANMCKMRMIPFPRRRLGFPIPHQLGIRVGVSRCRKRHGVRSGVVRYEWRWCLCRSRGRSVRMVPCDPIQFRADQLRGHQSTAS